jgi:hypothetical protein
MAVEFRKFIGALLGHSGDVFLFAHFGSDSQRNDSLDAIPSVTMTFSEFEQVGFPSKTVATVRAQG